MTRIPFILLSTSDGSPVTGATPTVTISKDGGAFASATNQPHEIGSGYYYVDLTTTETAVNNNVIVRATATGAQPTAVVWEPEQDLSGLATSQDITNSQAVIIGAMPTTDGLATSQDVADIATTANAIKAKTDALPNDPAAASDIPSDYAKPGDAMTLTPAAVTDVQTGLAFESDITSAEDTIIGNIVAAMPDVSGLATSSDLADVATTANGIKAKTDALPAVPAAKSDIPTAGDNATAVWDADNRSLTTEIEVEISADDISDIAAGVWNHTPRTISGDPSSTVVYCNTAMLYAHWTQDKIDAWAGGSQDAIDAAIVSASRKIDNDLDQAVSTPFQPVPADIRDLCILAAGVILARQAGDTDNPSVTAAESYYVKFVEDYNYTADN